MHQQPNIVCFGELLWDILPTGAVPGGAPMNVAYHLHRLGLRPSLITRVGNDERGYALRRIVTEQGISSEGIQADEQVPTGIVLAQPDEAHEMHYDIVAPAAWDYIAPEPKLETATRNADYFVYGSLAARQATTRHTLLQLLEHTTATKVFDINLRPPHYTATTLEALLRKADILKMNQSELELLSGWYGYGVSLPEKITSLRRQFHIPLIIVTRGANGAAADDRGQYFSHPGFPVTVADTVGSGDAFLAAFLYGVSQGRQVEECLSAAAALGALVASKTGGWPAYTTADISTVSGETHYFTPAT